METIARIPNLVPAVPEGNVAAPEPAAARPPIPVGAGRRKPPFPAWSVASLALIATIAWMLASWHEQDRLDRQRRPIRLAQQPPATARETIAP